MPAMSQFHRRLVVARAGEEARAVAYLREEGLGFCRAGPSPNGGGGGDLWSWWNPYTARYFPQKHRLPSLDHVNQDQLRMADLQDLGVRAQQVATGSTGPWPTQSPGLGFAHPWGIEQGGMVSGLEIHLYEGITTAAAASNAGYRFAQLVHRMLDDRQKNVLFDANGLPTRMEEWVVPGPSGDLFPIWWFGGPILWASDPFGITTSPSFQRDAVAALGRQPPWEGAFLAFETIDAEHLIRYTRMAKELAWLGNDALAKDDLLGQAEGVRMGYNMYRQDSYPQGVIVTGMLFDRRYVDQHPGWGLSYGRAEGWGLDTMCAAYSLGDPQWRADVRPWFDLVIDLLRDGQTDCTGVIQATPLTNVFNAQYRCRQSIEAGITENAIVGMRESVFRGDDNVKVSETNGVLERAFYAMISAYVWDEDGHGPWALFGVGNSNTDLPPFCNWIPPDGTYGFPDHALIWCSLAYGYEVTHDAQFLNKAAEAMGVGDLTAGCYSFGANEIQNRAALLALVQELDPSSAGRPGPPRTAATRAGASPVYCATIRSVWITRTRKPSISVGRFRIARSAGASTYRTITASIGLSSAWPIPTPSTPGFVKRSDSFRTFASRAASSSLSSGDGGSCSPASGEQAFPTNEKLCPPAVNAFTTCWAGL
jgi:hypothetical protein